MLTLALAAAATSIIFSLVLIYFVKQYPTGEGKQLEIWQAIREGSKAHLRRQNITVFTVVFLIAIVLWQTFDGKIAVGFLLGAFASALAGYFGMLTVVDSNVRTVEAAKKSMAHAFQAAFRGGSVTGFLVVGLGLLVVSSFYYWTREVGSLIGLAFGSSLISVFTRLGGGIYTKGADVRADLVGKVEVGIPEDDSRNPAVIADNIGDNVGDCAGMAADLFETYVVTTIAAMLLGSLLFPGTDTQILLPLMIGALAIFASIIGSFFVRIQERTRNVMGGLYKGLIASSIVVAILLWPAFAMTLDRNLVNGYFISALMGILVTALIFVSTGYYTSKKSRPVKAISRASLTGHATNIIMGLSFSFEATVFPILVISAGILIAFLFGGLYGVALAAVTMLAMAGIIVAIDSFGPITDNAGGIAEMTGLSEEIRTRIDPLDAVGNTTKAVTRGYAIASASLATLVLFASYVEELRTFGKSVLFELSDPYVLVGLFTGGVMTYFFVAVALRSVGKAEQGVVEEARRQFRDIKSLMEGKVKPQYKKAVDIVTKSALRQMIISALTPVVFPIFLVLVLGSNAPKGLGGFLVGSIVTGLFVAISMTSGGAAWDNAKKYIEEGNYGGKKSPAHQAAVTGDTVGDSYKDTVGPAVNPMIKIVNIVALLIARLL